MRVVVTGASGFLGRHVAGHFLGGGHDVVTWWRPGGRDPADDRVRCVEGSLTDPASMGRLVAGADAVVHAAVFNPGDSLVGQEGDPGEYYAANVVGTVRLIDAARAAGVGRFVFISSGAVHQTTLSKDRLPGGQLDETHPLWPASVYGASKAAVETFIAAIGHSDAESRGGAFVPATLRPTSIYGVDEPIESSRYFDVVRDVVAGRDVDASGGGKVVHADDIARACETLIDADADKVRGETFNCTGGSVARRDVAELAVEVMRRRDPNFRPGEVSGDRPTGGTPMSTVKLEALGFEFRQAERLRETVETLVDSA